MQCCAKAIITYQDQLKQLQAETQSISETAETLPASAPIQEPSDELDPSIERKNVERDLLAKINDLKIKASFK